MIIGQNKLQNFINSTSSLVFPKTILFVGDVGCGKHLFASLISNKLNIPIVDITDAISSDTISDINISVLPKLYLINIDLLIDKKQNCLLKFTEEPPTNAYLILLTTNINSVLDTIINRSIVFNFEPYSEAELKTFISDKTYESEILDICKTPGQILKFNHNAYMALDDLCTKLISYYNNVSFANLMTITNKLNVDSKSQDKLAVIDFLNLMTIKSYSLYINTKQNSYYNIFKISNMYANRLSDSRLNKENIVLSYLADLWRLTK